MTPHRVPPPMLPVTWRHHGCGHEDEEGVCDALPKLWTTRTHTCTHVHRTQGQGKIICEAVVCARTTQRTCFQGVRLLLVQHSVLVDVVAGQQDARCLRGTLEPIAARQLLQQAGHLGTSKERRELWWERNRGRLLTQAPSMQSINEQDDSGV